MGLMKYEQDIIVYEILVKMSVLILIKHWAAQIVPTSNWNVGHLKTCEAFLIFSLY